MSIQLKEHFGGTYWVPTEYESMTFPGGEPHVKFDGPLSSSTYLIEAKIQSFNDVGEMLVLNDALRRMGASNIILFCPYLPGARQDRGEPFTARVYADVINNCQFDAVVAVDPHSDVMPALIDNLYVVELTNLLRSDGIIMFYKYFIAPDAGAIKRVESAAQLLGKEVLYGRKHRDMKTGKLSGFSCEPIPGKDKAVVIDDICDGGGTFIGLAEALSAPRERLALWTTHGIYSKGLKELSEYYSIIYCTDSLPSENTRKLILFENNYVQDLLWQLATRSN